MILLSIIIGQLLCLGAVHSAVIRSPLAVADLPSPIQGGLAENCDAFYKVQNGDSCWSIVNSYGNFTLEEFYSWNPSIGRSCERLYPDYFVCVGTADEPKPAPTPTAHPKPEQPGIPPECSKFHKVVAGDSCWAIANQYGISLEQFYKWNTSLQPSCRSLLPDYYVCVGVANPPAAKPTSAESGENPEPTPKETEGGAPM
ncbi:LysM domain protein [Aspergillus clavatus NRRL 1]|uniref:LysM domain protein n=1 Tax=Aspergillus clavatus (strain ATCC 1007 / CBS 513.65 / DSM 816 / NCTC 3887 / NRRL 1 / QM 1276 / 107) TaxID=344612 RepID=A1CNR4_ASPCL|nr:LysM domain protein [Aspergillus clavatus NRRL 1]EAW07285.1 LysM domain protein [Aspergillus clavatus NRRL 1]